VLVLALRGVASVFVHFDPALAPHKGNTKYSSIYNHKDRSLGEPVFNDEHIAGGIVDTPGDIVIDSSELPLSSAPGSGFNTSDNVVRMTISDLSHGNLILVNHDYRFDIPVDQDLVRIYDHKTPSFRLDVNTHLLAPHVIMPLNDMMDSFYAQTGHNTVAVISAFRGLSRQQYVLNEHIAIMGSAEAHRWVALPGHSEHHTGLAFDLGFYSGGRLRTFTGTGVYAWFRDNSYNYGFILRFPESGVNITGTYYEPWHYRYVGLPHSYLIFQNDWVLEDYIGYIAEYSQDEPLVTEYNGVVYEIFFTSDFEIFIPLNCEFDISGNNTDGFIVTMWR